MIHPIAKVTEEVDRNCHRRNTTVKLSTPHRPLLPQCTE